MATSFPDAGPLDDYFRDEIDQSLISQHPIKGQSLDMELDNRRHSDLSDESGTLVNPSSTSPTKGWTGSLPNTAGPSSISVSSSISLSDVPGKFPSPHSLSFSDETFAERFKYLICSGGLLEKDYVPAHIGTLDADLEDDRNQQDQWRIIEDWVEKGKQRWDLVLAGVALLLGLAISLDIWTILGVAIILLGGIAWYQGHITISNEAKVTTPSTLNDDTPQTLALASLTNFIAQSHSLNITLSTSLSLLEPHPYNLHTLNSLRVTLHRLTGNMTDHLATATSTLLELTDRRELAVLGEMYDIPVVGSFFYSRRHQSITDSTSEEEYDQSLSRSAELPMMQRPGLPHRSSSNPSPPKKPTHASGSSTSSLPSYKSTSPLKKLQTNVNRPQRLSFGTSPDLDDRFTQIPDRTPRLSKRASVERLRDTWSQSPRFERPRHERRITEADEEEEEENEHESSRSSDHSFSSDDNTPVKVERRSSEIGSAPEAILKSPTSPQTRAGLGVTIPRTPMLTRETPRRTSVSSPFKHIPSPLSKRLSTASGGLQPLRTAPFATPSRSAPGSTTLLPSPFVNDREPVSTTEMASSAPLRAALSLDPISSTAMGNPKRRSLQNMPYYHSSSDENQDSNLVSISAGLTRTRSMPLSDLQALRTASAIGGSRSRRSSINPTTNVGTGLGIGIGLPSSFPVDKRSSISTIPPSSPNLSVYLNTNLRRIESISPLTTPGLKASCLGIHLKRRRLTCCLLGLKFDKNQDDSFELYWKDVKLILDELNQNIIEEKEVLDKVIKESEKEIKARLSLDGFGSQKSISTSAGLWSSSSSTFPYTIDNGIKDFAPRTSDEVSLFEHIDKFSTALVGAWKDLSNIKENMKLGNININGMNDWNEIRAKLGDGIREWERGKEVINRMNEPEMKEEVQVGDEARNDNNNLPEFIESWKDSDSTEEIPQPTFLQSEPSKNIESNNLSSQKGENIDFLPPVGKDTIFEGISSISLSEDKVLLSNLSREERIKLTQQARENGMSLKELISQQNGNGVDQENNVKEMRIKGGQVVNELRGVIGSIRKMKGGEEEDEGDTVENENIGGYTDSQFGTTANAEVDNLNEGAEDNQDSHPFDRSWNNSDDYPNENEPFTSLKPVQRSTTPLAPSRKINNHQPQELNVSYRHKQHNNENEYTKKHGHENERERENEILRNQTRLQTNRNFALDLNELKRNLSFQLNKGKEDYVME